MPRSLLTAQVSCKVRALRPASLANTLRLQLRSRFGDVFSLQLAWTPVVVINGLAAVREALVHRSEDTADRPPAPIYEHLGFGPRAQGKRRTGQAAAPRGQASGDPQAPAEEGRGRAVHSANRKARPVGGACAEGGRGVGGA